MQYLIPAASLVAGGLLGFLLGRAQAWALFWGTVAVLIVVVGWQWFKAQSAASGMDGIAILLLVFLFLMPGLIGLLVGAGAAWWKARMRALAQDAGEE